MSRPLCHQRPSPLVMRSPGFDPRGMAIFAIREQEVQRYRPIRRTQCCRNEIVQNAWTKGGRAVREETASAKMDAISRFSFEGRSLPPTQRGLVTEVKPADFQFLRQ